ncbi:MAG: phosphoribosyltransferase family protein [Propionibacteriales bacterium]|nr:phosphoribosyltransferase family protein [Propionibacteriales bacterium]
MTCRDPGRVLCAGCASRLPTAGVRVRPDPEPPGLAPVFVAGPYEEPLKGLLVAHKERRVLGLADPLGRVLAGVVGSAVNDDSDLVLVAVPSRAAAVRTRGHDPVARMVRAAVRHLRAQGRPATGSTLLRQHPGVRDQAGLDVGQRTANLAGALRVDPSAQRRLAGRWVTVVVCDDIVTTGVTVREAQRALAAVGIEVATVAAVAATRRRRAEGPGSA